MLFGLSEMNWSNQSECMFLSILLQELPYTLFLFPCRLRIIFLLVPESILNFSSSSSLIISMTSAEPRFFPSPSPIDDLDLSFVSLMKSADYICYARSNGRCLSGMLMLVLPLPGGGVSMGGMLLSNQGKLVVFELKLTLSFIYLC